MKFLIDENLPLEVGERLRQANYDVAIVKGKYLSGKPDIDIVSACHLEDRVLVSLDLDFVEIRTYPPADFPGFLLLRLKRQDRNYLLEIIENLIQMLSKEPIERQLWIVEEDQIRIRS